MALLSSGRTKNGQARFAREEIPCTLAIEKDDDGASLEARTADDAWVRLDLTTQEIAWLIQQAAGAALLLLALVGLGGCTVQNVTNEPADTCGLSGTWTLANTQPDGGDGICLNAQPSSTLAIAIDAEGYSVKEVDSFKGYSDTVTRSGCTLHTTYDADGYTLHRTLFRQGGTLVGESDWTSSVMKCTGSFSSSGVRK
jgi:hypothetical protein